MENFDDLPLEVRLSAYLDGQVSDAQKRALDATLAIDAHARELLDLLKSGSDFGNQAFADMLKEPVPLHMVRAIKTGGSASAGGGRTPANGNVVSLFRFIPQAMAASVVLLLAGGYSGYFIGLKNGPEVPVEVAEISSAEAPSGTPVKTRSFTFNASAAISLPAIAVSAVAEVHDIYARQARLVEMPASDSAGLKTWLAASTGVAFEIPDLAADGLTFEGGRLVAVDGSPTGALFYKNAKGDVVAVYFAKGSLTGGQTSVGTSEYVSGAKGETAWVVAGPAGDKTLAVVAGKVAATL
jgi:anti-sigma factor RsiW